MGKEEQMNLCVVVPGIRKANWFVLYDSIKKSYSGEWELYIIGPYEPDFKRNNLRWIKSYRTPVQCCQEGVFQTKAKYITFGADDGKFLPDALDKIMEIAEKKQYKDVTIGKYVESDSEASWKHMTDPNYYRTNFHDGLRANIPDHYLQMMQGILTTRAFVEIGGFDCRFETGAYAHIDLSIRMQNDGSNFQVVDIVVFTCSWDPGLKGDHAPIHLGTMENDQPLYDKLYKEMDNSDRTVIGYDNWKEQPEIWKRRFKNGMV